METVIEAKSTFMGIFSRAFFRIFGLAKDEMLKEVLDGKMRSEKSPVGFWDIITPWHISVDTKNKRITVTKRNWYLLSKNEDVFAFKSVRHVSVKNHVFGADLGIKMYVGHALVYSISKSDAKKIREILMNVDWNKQDTDVLIDM